MRRVRTHDFTVSDKEISKETIPKKWLQLWIMEGGCFSKSHTSVYSKQSNKKDKYLHCRWFTKIIDRIIIVFIEGPCKKGSVITLFKC